jgi:hypothetical protein
MTHVAISTVSMFTVGVALQIVPVGGSDTMELIRALLGSFYRQAELRARAEEEETA